mgnify:CR=1 FL=1
MHKTMLVAAAALAVSACGEDNSAKGASGLSADSAAAMEGPPTATPARAADVVAAAEIDCRTVKEQRAPAGQPADDIIGIRQGMGAEEVRALLSCKNPNYVIEEQSGTISLAGGGEASEVSMKADTGLDRVSVHLIGPAGREKVVHVARTVEYVEGSELPIAAIEQELERKYGRFDDDRRENEGFIILARGGQRLGTGNSLYNQCRMRPDSYGSWHSIQSSKCGDVVRYRVEPHRENDDLAFRFSVGVTNFDEAAGLAAEANKVAAQETQEELDRAQEAAGQGIDL